MTSIHFVKLRESGAPEEGDGRGSLARQLCGPFSNPDDAMEQLCDFVYKVPAEESAKPGEELLPCVKPHEPGSDVSSSCTCSSAAVLGGKRCLDCFSAQEQQQIPSGSSVGSTQRNAPGAEHQDVEPCSTCSEKQAKMQKVAQQPPHPPQAPCQGVFAAGSSSMPSATGGPESSSDKSTCSRNTPPPQLVDQEEQSQPLPVPLLEVGTICATATDAFGAAVGLVDSDFFQDAAAAFTEMLQGVSAEDDGDAEGKDEEEGHDGCDAMGAFFVDGVEDLPDEICCTTVEEPGAALEEDDGSQFFADAANAVAEMIEDAAVGSSFGDVLEDVLPGGGSSGNGAPSSAPEENPPRCPSSVFHDCAPEEHRQLLLGNAAPSAHDSETASRALPGATPPSDGIDGVEPTFLDCLTDIFPDSETDEPDLRGGTAAVEAPGAEPRVPLSPVHAHPCSESPKCTPSSPSPSFHDCEDIGREPSSVDALEDALEDAASPSPSFHDCDDGQLQAAKISTSTFHDCLPSSATAAASEDASLRAKPREDPDPEGFGAEEHCEDDEDEYYEEEEDEVPQSGFRWISEAELLKRSPTC